MSFGETPGAALFPTKAAVLGLVLAPIEVGVFGTVLDPTKLGPMWAKRE